MPVLWRLVPRGSERDVASTLARCNRETKLGSAKESSGP